VLWKVFFALTIIIGVVAWLFVLAQQSRRAAEEETNGQTTLLYQEIDAHKLASYTHLRAHETPEHLVCSLLLEKKNNTELADDQ